MAGGKEVTVPLEPGSYSINYDRLQDAITDRTKVLLVNNPHNPTGRLYTKSEVEELANFLADYPQITVISDEVYEEHIYNDTKLARIGNLLWDRTASVYSGGKLFNVTGWKTGWAVGGAEVMKRLTAAKQWTTFCNNTPAQVAMANMLTTAEKPYKDFPTYYDWLKSDYKARRDALDQVLSLATAFRCVAPKPEAGYFTWAEVDMNIDDFKKEHYTQDGVELSHGFCRWLTQEKRVTAIPGSAFFSDTHKKQGRNFVRFAFCRKFEDFDEAAIRVCLQLK
jgi:aspartate/methionine/tyrosine aminotransferase